MSTTLQSKILDKLHSPECGYVCAMRELLELGEAKAVQEAVATLLNSGEIREIYQNILAQFRTSEFITTEVPPSPNKIQRAIAYQNNWKLYPTKETLLNYIGFDAQVPARFICSSTGPTLQVEVMDITFYFEHLDERLQKLQTLEELAIAYVLQSTRVPIKYRKKFLYSKFTEEQITEVKNALQISE